MAAPQGLKTVAPTIAVAWGPLCVHQLRNGCISGREFQIIPSGSMSDARNALHGLIGRPSPESGHLLMAGIRGTNTDALKEYQNELAILFSEKKDDAGGEFALS